MSKNEVNQEIWELAVTLASGGDVDESQIDTILSTTSHTRDDLNKLVHFIRIGQNAEKTKPTRIPPPEWIVSLCSWIAWGAFVGLFAYCQSIDHWQWWHYLLSTPGALLIVGTILFRLGPGVGDWKEGHDIVSFVILAVLFGIVTPIYTVLAIIVLVKTIWNW